MLYRTQGDHIGVEFTEENLAEMRSWLNDLAASEVVFSPNRIYLPVGVEGMVEVHLGDIVWHDPERDINPFYVERYTHDA